MTEQTVLVWRLERHFVTRESWAVARGSIEAYEEGPKPMGPQLVAVGPQLGTAARGDRVRLWGHLEDDHRHGRQLRVTAQEVLRPASRRDVHAWLTRLDGVGPVLAEALGSHFGDELVAELDSEPKGGPDPLEAVPGVGALKAKTIREAWQGLAAQADPETLRFLHGLGLTRWEVNQVLDFARSRSMPARKLLEAFPWTLAEAKGIGFIKADRIALRAGASPRSPARVEAALLYQVERLCEADTQVPLGRVTKQTRELLGFAGADDIESSLFRLARKGGVATWANEEGSWRVSPASLRRAEQNIARVALGKEE